MPRELKLRGAPRFILPKTKISVALLFAVSICLLLSCATRRYSIPSSTVNSSTNKFWLPPLYEKFGEKTGCETPQNAEFLKIATSAAGGLSSLYDLCQEPQPQDNNGTLAESSTADERQARLKNFLLTDLVSVPGKTFIRDSKQMQLAIAAIRDRSKSAKFSNLREIVLNVITSEQKLRQVDIWAGEDALAAALKSGVSTIGELATVLGPLNIDRKNFTILVNGKTAQGKETWPRWLESWNAPISYDLKSAFPINRKPETPENMYIYDGSLSNFQLGSRQTLQAYAATLDREQPKIVMLIGTMDPPHKGHHQTALFPIRNLGFKEAILLVNNAGHKPKAMHLQHRLNMTGIGADPEENLNVVMADYQKFELRFGLYALERRLQSAYGTRNFWTVTGSDAYIRDIVNGNNGYLKHDEQKLIVFPRAGDDLSLVKAKPEQKERFILAQAEDETATSSSILRVPLSKRERVSEKYLSAELQSYISKNCLYFENPPAGCPQTTGLSQFPGVGDATKLHQQSSNLERYEVIKNVKIADLFSAPGHQSVREEEKISLLSEQYFQKPRFEKQNQKEIFSEPVQISIFTDINQNNEATQPEVIVRSIEIQDGHHRMLAALLANCVNDSKGLATLADIAPEHLNILVNGFNTFGENHSHLIPLRCAASGFFARDSWHQLPENENLKEPTAAISGSIPGFDWRFTEDCQSITLIDVLRRTSPKSGIEKPLICDRNGRFP